MQNIEKQKQLDGGENGRMKEGAAEGIAKGGGAGIGLGINIPSKTADHFKKDRCYSLVQIQKETMGTSRF